MCPENSCGDDGCGGVCECQFPNDRCINGMRVREPVQQLTPWNVSRARICADVKKMSAYAFPIADISSAVRMAVVQSVDSVLSITSAERTVRLQIAPLWTF